MMSLFNQKQLIEVLNFKALMISALDTIDAYDAF